jgi:hypothetical protein
MELAHSTTLATADMKTVNKARSRKIGPSPPVRGKPTHRRVAQAPQVSLQEAET